VASYALALIGLFNVLGTYAAGRWASACPSATSWPSSTWRAGAIIAVFLLVPLSPGQRLRVFQRDGGVVAVHRAAHQCHGGADLWRGPPVHAGRLCVFQPPDRLFMGVWLGGYLYDRTGSYDIVWYIAIALGVLAALINLPVKEAAIAHRDWIVRVGAALVPSGRARQVARCWMWPAGWGAMCAGSPPRPSRDRRGPRAEPC
jgi:hypothetical protein